MSDETALRVAEAEMLESQMRARADERIRDCLSSIAAGLPSHLEAIAKRTAQSQPEVTKSLGSDGLKILRKELAELAQQLGSELNVAAEKIKWPEASSEYSKVSTRQIGTALFSFLYGSRVDRLASVFKRHGFSVGGGSGHSQSSILPQYLYQEESFAPLAEALNSLGSARQALASAKAADDKDTVASLWDDSGI